MIPSASSTGELTWHAAADNWADHHQAAAAAAAVGGAYSTTSASSSAAADSRYLNLHRHQILDWENAMLLAHHDSVYDQVDDYTKPSSITSMHADAIASLSHPRHYENLLSAHMQASNSNSLNNHNAWGLLNTVCSRNSGALQQEAASSFLQASSGPYSYESCLDDGAEGLGAYSNLAATGSLYADPLRSNSTHGGNMLGLTSFDQRRLDDIVKRELYTTHDFNSRLGLNLGGRTYFSADDFAFGRWGKRLRPNSPGCMMQPAPLCQAEGCKADLSMAKHYHRRHKVCEYHSKAATVHIGEQTQRFCQQCSRFHVLAEFDDGKRSCRKRLADHNRRRRKPQPAPTLAIEAAADAPKDQSQEAPTGSESLQNGTQSSKGSPTQVAEDQPTTTSASTPRVSSMGNINEASSNTGQLKVAIEQEKSEHIKPAATSSSKNPLTSNGSCAVANNKSNIKQELAGSCQLAANLSLGATDILAVKPGTPAIASNDNKHTVLMPWLQGPKKQQNMQGFPYNSSTKADHNADTLGGTDHLQYGEKGATSFAKSKSMDQGTDNRSSSWMMKGMTDGVSAGKSGNDTGGHELLRLLGDERELLNSNKHSAAMQANPSGIGTLAFLDHSLERSSAFTRDTEHRMIQFSSLQQSPAAPDQQVGHSSLHRPSSKFTFGNHNNMI